MTSVGRNNYEVVLDNKYYLRDLVEQITLDESLDEIAYRATIDLVVTPDFPGIRPGQEIQVSGMPLRGTEMVYLLHPGVVWDWTSRDSGQRRLTVTAYDRTIYLAKSEDEYLMPAGQTASQRLRRYAEDWGIPLGNVADTNTQLAKSLYRSQPIYSMIQSDLRETAASGGGLYRPRMTPDGLELAELGSNEVVWVLDVGQSLQEVTQRQTLEGAVTQVKVLGNSDQEEQSAPVLAVEHGETETYGTLQRILQSEKIKTAEQAKTAARGMLAGLEETFSVTAVDINTIRAGDKVMLDGSNMDLYVTSVRHDLGSPGRMSLELATWDHIRRKYYGPV